MSWLPHQVRARPQATALRLPRPGGARTVIYRELGELAGAAAGRLAGEGVGPGDRVAVALPNTLEHVVAVHAVSWLGAVLVPLEPRLDAAEAARRLEAVAARLVVTDRPTLAGAEVLPAEALTSGSGSGRGRGPGGAPPPVRRSTDDLHSIVFTSGSTGRPEPVELTWGNHFASAAASALNLGIDRRDDWLCCLPLVHVGGLAIVLRSTLQGTALTLLDGFDVGRVAELLRGGRITLVSLVPTMLRRLLDRADEGGSLPGEGAGADPGSGALRAILLGGGPADPALIERAWEAGLPVLATYGMTETASQVATVPPDRLHRPGEDSVSTPEPGSTGPPLLGAEIAIRGASGATLPAGSSGEIWIRGPMVSPSAPTDAEGWLRTGDVGRLDARGDLWVRGRRDQVIVTGGKNVSPERVEAALGADPEVAACAVVGVDDPEWGRAVAAAVVPRDPDHPPDPAALAERCRERLAPYEVPKRWRVVDELPWTASGKPRREAVVALVAAGEPPDRPD